MNNDNQPRFGFVNFAETWNGRMAMMGILIGLGTELITGQSILRQIGIKNKNCFSGNKISKIATKVSFENG